MTYCDLTTGPDGNRVAVSARLAELGERLGEGNPGVRAVRREAARLAAVVEEMEELAGTGEAPDRGLPVPRIDWVIRADIRRAADWLNENTCVDVVALDWMTVRSPEGWLLCLDGLRMLDELTERRLWFLVNGPSNRKRRAALRELVNGRVSPSPRASRQPAASRGSSDA